MREECLEPKYPSVLKQTAWPCGTFSFSDELNPHDGNTGVRHFNPAIARVNGDTLLFTRRISYTPTKVKPSLSDHSTVSVWKIGADKQLSHVSNPSLPLRTPAENWDDPRVFSHNGKTYVSCCTWSHGPPGRQTIGLFNSSMQSVHRLCEPDCGHNCSSSKVEEKNWTYFVSENKLYLVYTIAPLKIYELDENFRTVCEYAPESSWEAQWKFGVPQGGTNPFLCGDELITFFHSYTAWKTTRRRYFMGALAFKASPPFSVTRFTPNPLLVGSESDLRELNGPLVVFPCGALFENHKWLVSFGINDEKCGWIEIPHDDLSKLMC